MTRGVSEVKSRAIVLIGVVLALVFAMALPGPGASVLAQKTWHVSVNGSDTEGDGSYVKPWRTIQYAIDRAGNGDVIVVNPGVYNEQLNINKGITLTSPTADYLTSNVVLTGGGAGWALITVGSAGSGSTIQGLRFEKVASSEAVIFGDVGAHNITIKSNSFVDCAGPAVFLYDTGDRNSYRGWLIANNRVNGILGTGKAGLNLGTLTDSKVEDNIVERVNGPAVVLGHFENVTISNNRISDFLVAGILVPETAPPHWGSGLFISGNLIDGTVQAGRGQVEAPDGIRVTSYVTDVRITGNALTGNKSGCVVFGSEPVGASVGVNFNSIYGNIDYGVQNLSGGRLNATNNWWGGNDGPGGAGRGSGDKISADVEYDPWLKLELVAESKSVVIGGGATLTLIADMTKNSRGESTAEKGHLFDGTEVGFTTEQGTFDNKATKVTKATTDGKAIAILTAGNAAGGVVVCAEAPHRSEVPSEQYRQCVLINFVTGTAQTIATATRTGQAIFASSLGNITGLTPVAENAAGCARKPSSVVFPHGLFSFNVVDIAPGSVVTVSITLPSPTPKGTQFWQCRPDVGWYQVPVGSDDGDNVITIGLTDGGAGDLDGIANGVIVVSGGPAILPQSLARLRVDDLKVEPEEVFGGQPVNIRVKLTNGGDVVDTYPLVATVNGQVEHKQAVRVDAKSTSWYEFTVVRNQPGTYTVSVDTREVVFKVLSPGERPSGPLGGWLIAVICVLVAVVVVGGIMSWWLVYRRPPKKTEQ